MTFQGFADAWPSREGEFADKFNDMPKYVVSSTIDGSEWSNSTVLEGDVAEAVANLKQEQDGDIVVHGSAQLVQTLLEHGLVDELRLMVFLVVLGGQAAVRRERRQAHLQLTGLEDRRRRRQHLVYRVATEAGGDPGDPIHRDVG